MKKYIVTFILLFSFTLSSCGKSISKKAVNLMEDIPRSDLVPVEISSLNKDGGAKKEEITDFALKLLSENFEKENILISPLSIVSALAMVANGANNQTLSEMEKVLNSDIQELNDYLKAYKAYLPNNKKYEVSLANSIWFKDDKNLNVKEEFLNINKDYYDASVYKTPFDKKAKDDINAWVNLKTKGMIETLLAEPPSEDTIMYLINALSFDAEWEDIYHETQIYPGEFNVENGNKEPAEFMSSSEHIYLENENVTGFMKPYKDSKYAFVAMLPRENIQMADLLKSIEAKDILSLIENKKDNKVYTEIPKFSVDYSTMLNDSLQSLGIINAFDSEKADFTGIGKYNDKNIYISRVIHKTKIEVNEKGTKAGAVTAVEMDTTSAPIEEPKEVVLDRPFIYMIVDTEENLPLFIGSLMNVN
ncbi:MAG: serpin [Clostridium sp.]|nr:serpin [Clostridium sp.]